MTSPVDYAALKAKAEAATQYEGYSVDRDGNVWSTSGWRGIARRKLTPHPNSNGYMRVKVKTPAGLRSAFVHKMVCAAFNGPRPSAVHEVRHLDGNKANNAAANLLWGTRSENALDRKRHGTERAAENGRRSAYKLRGRVSPNCIRGHFKEGRRDCEQCRRERRVAARSLIAKHAHKPPEPT